jgi:AcrR family transcriptional regulator
MPRVGLTTDAVVDTAMAIVDEGGLNALTLAAVAARSDVAAPSLYKHISGLPELRTLVTLRVLRELTERLTDAVLGRSGDAAIEALMWATRQYVREYPARYAAGPADPLGDPALAEAGGRLMEVVLAVLRGYQHEGSDAIHATRCLRSIVHGFCAIEAAGGFGLPEDLDETFRRLIQMATTSMGGSR